MADYYDWETTAKHCSTRMQWYDLLPPRIRDLLKEQNYDPEAVFMLVYKHGEPKVYDSLRERIEALNTRTLAD